MQAEVKLDQYEIWSFVTDVHHPVHVHLAATTGVEDADQDVGRADPATADFRRRVHRALEQQLGRLTGVRVLTRARSCRRQQTDPDRDPGDAEAVFPLAIQRGPDRIFGQAGVRQHPRGGGGAGRGRRDQYMLGLDRPGSVPAGLLARAANQ